MNNEGQKLTVALDVSKLKQKISVEIIEEIRQESKLIKTTWLIVLKRKNELSQRRAELMKKKFCSRKF